MKRILTLLSIVTTASFSIRTFIMAKLLRLVSKQLWHSPLIHAQTRWIDLYVNMKVRNIIYSAIWVKKKKNHYSQYLVWIYYFSSCPINSRSCRLDQVKKNMILNDLSLPEFYFILFSFTPPHLSHPKPIYDDILINSEILKLIRTPHRQVFFLLCVWERKTFHFFFFFF